MNIQATVLRSAHVKDARRFATRVGLILFALTCWLSMAQAASTIDISEHRWGFNGKVASHRFNLLSVLVNNPTPQQFTGEILLQKSLGGAGTVDATIVETVTLAPNSSKWVQFYPYISSDIGNGISSENWFLTYRGGSFPLNAPHIAKYQRIILDDPNSVTPKGGAVKFHLPDNLFPPFVTATDALQLVVLDHVPRWEENRRQAFLDWLYLGGTVVVLQDVSGKFPEFAGPLSVLKTPLEDQLFGAGRVVQLPFNRAQFSEDALRQVCAALPKNYQPVNSEKSNDIVDRVDEVPTINQNQFGGQYGEGTDPFKSNSFLGQLKQMTKPEHNWLLLHVMFWVYIGLVFPGCYVLGKRWSDFRIVYAGLLGTVAVFSLLFSYVGQRGYGEATAVHTVAIAKPLSDGQMDVASWSNIFVTSGAVYEIRHNAFGTLYSTCNDHEQVKGEINNGAEAVFKVDIPPFSNREMAAREKIAYLGPKLTIESFKEQNGRISELKIDVQGLKQADVEKQFALIGNMFYLLNWQDGKLVLANETGNVSGFLRIQDKHNNQYNYGYPYFNDYNKQTPAERYAQMFDLLISRGLSVSRERDAEQLQLPQGVVKVFLYGKMPDEFKIQNKRLGHQDGRVLFCIPSSLNDVKKP